MKVLDNVVISGTTYAYCVGEELCTGFTCKGIKCADKMYEVESTGVNNTISDVLVALLKIKDNVEVPIGEVTVVY